MSERLQVFGSPEPPALRLFCFPYAGGGPEPFGRWRRGLPDRCELVAVDYPGHGFRPQEPPVESALELACELAGAMAAMADLPFALFGHSMGALIAYETARELASMDLMPTHLFVSGRGAPQRRLPPDPGPLSDAAIRERLRSLGGTPAQVLDNDELMERLMPALRADFRICDSYVHEHEAPLTISLETFAGDRDPSVTPAEIAEWVNQTVGPTDNHVIRGGHFFLHTADRSVVAAVARALERCPGAHAPTGRR